MTSMLHVADSILGETARDWGLPTARETNASSEGQSDERAARLAAPDGASPREDRSRWSKWSK
jgi:hypothetical protein